MVDHPLGKEVLPHVNRPLLHPAQCAPAHLTVGQLVQKDAVRDSIKSLTKIQKSHVHRLPFTHQAGDLMLEGRQMSEAGLSLCDPMLTVPDAGIVLEMPFSSTQ